VAVQTEFAVLGFGTDDRPFLNMIVHLGFHKRAQFFRGLVKIK